MSDEETARIGPMINNHMMGKMTPGGVHDGMLRFGDGDSAAAVVVAVSACAASNVCGAGRTFESGLKTRDLSAMT